MNYNAIYDFMVRTIVGQESGLYRVFSVHPSMIVHIKEDSVWCLLQPAKLDYYNTLYKVLILKNDPDVLLSFADMNCHHSKICLLNILLLLETKTHQSIHRSTGDISTRESWVKFIRDYLNGKDVREQNIQEIQASLNHECSGIDISTCDPNVKVFTNRTK